MLASEFLCLTHLQLSVLDRDFGPLQVFVERNFITLLDSLRKLLLTTTRENKICYVMGDFNLDLLRHEQHTITEEFVLLMFSHLPYPMITKPTRITSNTTSRIDNIFANNVHYE